MMAPAGTRRDRLREMLADLKMPGALEAVDGLLAQADSGTITAAEAIEQLLDAQIGLRNNRRLQAAMRSSRLPAVKTLGQFDFAFQPSIKREQIESLHEFGFESCIARLAPLGLARKVHLSCPCAQLGKFNVNCAGPGVTYRVAVQYFVSGCAHSLACATCDPRKAKRTR